jgi:thiosulfate/3-mercaptopyruvate sulfurtransferase
MMDPRQLTQEQLQRLREEHLVETEWLETHLDDPKIRIVDMRGKVQSSTQPDGSQNAAYFGCREAYAEGHIPGAVYLDWTSDLIDERDPVPAQAAPPEKLARVLGAAGIGDETLVVAYDDHAANQFATRLWWLLRYYGHGNVRVLNGGWPKWIGESRPISAAVPHPEPAVFIPKFQPHWRMTAEEVASRIGDAATQIVDARDEGQFTGRIRRGIRGGHIPGALHFPREAITTEDHAFLAPEQLQDAARSAGVDPDREVVAYCNGGVAATSVLFALSMLGYSKLANYDGTWNEWNKRPELPVERSGEP